MFDQRIRFRPRLDTEIRRESVAFIARLWRASLLSISRMTGGEAGRYRLILFFLWEPESH
jgi:hypothetical protein